MTTYTALDLANSSKFTFGLTFGEAMNLSATMWLGGVMTDEAFAARQAAEAAPVSEAVPNPAPTDTARVRFPIVRDSVERLIRAGEDRNSAWLTGATLALHAEAQTEWDAACRAAIEALKEAKA